MKVVRDTAAEAPLYARLLRLRYIHPGTTLCFALFEGTTIIAGLLALAELTSWWAVIVLPLTVAGMVKVNDVAAGAFAASFTPSLAMVGDGRGGQGERRRLVGNSGARLLPDRTRPLAGVGIGPLTDGVLSLLGGRQRRPRHNTVASRLVTAPRPRRRAGEQATMSDRTEALRQQAWRATEERDLQPPAQAAVQVPAPAEPRPAPPNRAGQRPAGPWTDDDAPTMPLVRRGRHAADASDDLETVEPTAARSAAVDGEPDAGRPGSDEPAPGRVYGTVRPTDDDETPAVGWLRWTQRGADGEPARDERPAVHGEPSGPRDESQQPPAQRGQAPGRSRRQGHDDDGAVRYRNGFNQGRFHS